MLPEAVLRLPGELARVDALLDDPVFFAPFAPYFDPLIGRPSTPVECYLRLMFLKFRYRLGYESMLAATMRPSTVNGRSRAVWPDSPCALTSS
jgi:IS5 family transposase